MPDCWPRSVSASVVQWTRTRLGRSSSAARALAEIEVAIGDLRRDVGATTGGSLEATASSSIVTLPLSSADEQFVSTPVNAATSEQLLSRGNHSM